MGARRSRPHAAFIKTARLVCNENTKYAAAKRQSETVRHSHAHVGVNAEKNFGSLRPPKLRFHKRCPSVAALQRHKSRSLAAISGAASAAVNLPTANQGSTTRHDSQTHAAILRVYSSRNHKRRCGRRVTAHPLATQHGCLRSRLSAGSKIFCGKF